MKSKQGLSGQISVWVERQALAALLSSSARRSTSCLTYWQIKSDVSQSAVRFPSERQLVTRLWLLSLQPGVIRRRRREGCWPPRVMMMCYWPAVNFTPFCLTETLKKINIITFTFKILVSWVFWYMLCCKLGQFGLGLAAQQLSRRACHQLPREALNTYSTKCGVICLSKILVRQECTLWDDIYGWKVFGYGFLAQTKLQFGGWPWTEENKTWMMMWSKGLQSRAGL